jgi:hypothetical protein
MHRRLTIALVKNTIDSTFFRGMAEQSSLHASFVAGRPRRCGAESGGVFRFFRVVPPEWLKRG